mmetsp:Transcript_134576/g.339979  ORF Transcript_134576/g.339979 Transcript_134576/m.339979 type:complete len:592 (+) Transcript_134576:31-1806(+)
MLGSALVNGALLRPGVEHAQAQHAVPATIRLPQGISQHHTGQRSPGGLATTSLASGLVVALASRSAVRKQQQHRREKSVERSALTRSIPGYLRSSWLGSVKDSWKPEALRGNWSPVHTECAGLRAEVVAGAIPVDFPDGHFVQNGPNPRWVRPNAGYHPFEGDGMLHSVEIASAGKGSQSRCARYSNSWVRTAKWFAEDVAQRPLASGFIDDDMLRMGLNAALNVASVARAVPNIMWDGGLVAGGSGTANTSVIYHAGKVLALQEGSKPIVVSMPHLATEGPLAGSRGFTAHPKICPKTGELIWFNYGSPAGMSYGVWDRHGHPIHETVIPLPHSVMVHDIAITSRHTVVLDCPLRLAPDFTRGQGPVHLNKDIPMRFGILPRRGHGEDVTWYEVPGPGKMCFHVMNAYEHPSGDIVVVGCAQPEVSIWDMNLQHAHLERLTEWRISPRTKRVQERVLSEVPCDFPRINERFVGRPFRFGYAAAFDPGMCDANALKFRGVTKHDVHSAETATWEPGSGVYVGEPVFVPRVGADPDAEEDGYILVYSHNESTRTSEVLVLDARDFGQPPVCRIQLPRRVPYGFHVAWVPAEH